MRALLIHGIWMRAWTLAVLRQRLRAAGFACAGFNYPSVTGGPEPSIARLASQLEQAGEPTAIVAHSLGGLIALETLRRHPQLPVPRVVCLGVPLRGAQAARGLLRWRGGARVLGRSADILCGGMTEWSGTAEVGSIAGTRAMGIGVVIGGLRPPHDGTVEVAETILPGIADHATLDTTHTTMVFDPRVAALTARFLRTGSFAA